MAEMVYQLSGEQQRILNQVVAQLKDWGEEANHPNTHVMRCEMLDGLHPIPRPEFQRVMMLDGARGAGKTSLLLTLVAARCGQKTIAVDEKTQKVINELRDALQPHIFLPTVDFDPLPDSMPPYVWLLSAFQGVCESLTKRSSTQVSTRTKPTLKRQLQALQQTALFGWGEDGTTIQNTNEDWMISQRLQMLSWKNLPCEWASFVDHLVDALQKCRYLGECGVIVVPVDDLDMRLRSLRHTLLALRQLTHPRVVFLLCGHSGQMQTALTWELLQRVVGRGVWPDPIQVGEWAEGPHGQPKRLAQEILKKQIAPRHRYLLPLMSLRDARSQKIRVRQSELKSIKELPGGGFWDSVGELLKPGQSIDISFRELTDLIRDLYDDQHATNHGRSDTVDIDTLGSVLHRLNRHPELMRIEKSDGEWYVSGLFGIQPIAPTKASIISGNLWEGREFGWTHSASKEPLDEIGMLLVANGSGALDPERIQGSTIGNVSRWTYRYFGVVDGVTYPWMSLPRVGGGERLATLYPELCSADRHDHLQVLCQVFAERLKRSDPTVPESMDLWQLIECGMNREHGRVVPTVDEIKSIGLMALPESGLDKKSQEFLLTWLHFHGTLEHHRSVVVAAREERRTVITASDEVFFAITTTNEDRMEEWGSTARIAAGWVEIFQRIGRFKEAILKYQTLRSEGILRWCARPLDSGELRQFEQPLGMGDPSEQQSYEIMCSVWKVLRSSFQRMVVRFGDHSKSQSERIKQVCEAFPAEIHDIDENLCFQLSTEELPESDQNTDGVIFWDLRWWSPLYWIYCDTGGKRDQDPDLYDTLVWWLGVFSSTTPPFLHPPYHHLPQKPLPKGAVQHGTLLRFGENELPAPPLQRWVHVDRLYSHLQFCFERVRLSQARSSEDWFLSEVLVSCYAMISRDGTSKFTSLDAPDGYSDFSLIAGNWGFDQAEKRLHRINIWKYKYRKPELFQWVVRSIQFLNQWLENRSTGYLKSDKITWSRWIWGVMRRRAMLHFLVGGDVEIEDADMKVLEKISERRVAFDKKPWVFDTCSVEEKVLLSRWAREKWMDCAHEWGKNESEQCVAKEFLTNNSLRSVSFCLWLHLADLWGASKSNKVRTARDLIDETLMDKPIHYGVLLCAESYLELNTNWKTVLEEDDLEHIPPLRGEWKQRLMDGGITTLQELADAESILVASIATTNDEFEAINSWMDFADHLIKEFERRRAANPPHPKTNT